MKTEEIEHILSKYVNGIYTKEEFENLIAFARKREDDKLFEQNMDKLWSDAESIKDTASQTKTYEEDAKKLLNQLSHSPNRFTLKPLLKYAAAIALLVLGIWTVYYASGIIMSEELSYVTVSVDRGKRQKIILPDGTKVILNSNTNLKYPADFKGKIRSVEIDGEGFFDVKRDTDRPFIIHTVKADIQVLGTSFNVKAYNEDEEVAVSVKTGKVQVDIENATLKLLPNEQLILEKATNEYRKHQEDIKKVMLWTDGKLYFNRSSIKSVVLELQRIYDCEIEFAPDFTQDEYLYGEHENQSLEAVLNSIKHSTNVNYRKEGSKFILYKE